jgi:hypothetical protein
MTVLILTADSSSAGALRQAGRADIVIPIELRFVWGPPTSEAELAEFLATRTTQRPGSHWLDHVSPEYAKKFGSDMALIELCQRCDTVELWMETEPNAQLVLIWLLDYLRSEAKKVTRFLLRYVDSTLADAEPKHLANWRFDAVPVTSDLLETASLAWQAYRSPTPQDWFNLLNRNLSVLPQLRRCVLEMLEELPCRATGLGASEMRILELISAGYEGPFALFPHLRQRFQRRVYGYREIGSLLEGLALAPVPAISGLAEWPFELEMHNFRDRHERYKTSRLSLTPLGKAILEQADDFSRHNPIHRWWGGTELTNDRLWRWDPVLIAP